VSADLEDTGNAPLPSARDTPSETTMTYPVMQRAFGAAQNATTAGTSSARPRRLHDGACTTWLLWPGVQSLYDTILPNRITAYSGEHALERTPPVCGTIPSVSRGR